MNKKQYVYMKSHYLKLAFLLIVSIFTAACSENDSLKFIQLGLDRRIILSVLELVLPSVLLMEGVYMS